MSEKTCKCCGKRPPGEYVVRYGIYLKDLCVKCWRKGEISFEFKRNYGSGYHDKRGKS